MTWKWRKKYKNCDKHGISSQVIENNNRLGHSVYWLDSKTSKKWKQGDSRVKLKKKHLPFAYSEFVEKSAA